MELRILLPFTALICAMAALGQGTNSAVPASMPRAQQSPQPPAARVIDLKAPDGTVLKASYFAAAKPGPAVLLFHQSNRTRQSWDDVAGQLAAAGINTLTVDSRGHGESGGNYDNWTDRQTRTGKRQESSTGLDLDTAFEYLVSQPGVKRDLIGLGGAGLLGVDSSVETARRHSAEVKSLVLLSGDTLQALLKEASVAIEIWLFAA
jgi:dienelactone hydrolase